jgi:hypothetical protein
VLGVHVLQHGLLEVWMHLDLIHHGHHGRHRRQALDVVGHEVAHANRAHSAVGEQLLERPICLEGAVEQAR